jgi:glycosyltransferase involved in cell wall biosynthesis
MNLALFFSRNSSLSTWIDHGLLDREKLIYGRHISKGEVEKVYLLTYGSDDKKHQHLLPDGVIVVPMPKVFNFPFGKSVYSFLLPFIHRRVFRQCQVLKTDQMDGSWAAVITKLLYKKPLLIRTGFPLSVFMQRKSAKLKKFAAFGMEKLAYAFCDYTTVSSRFAREYVKNRYRIPCNKIGVLYNYIDLDLFRPINGNRLEDVLLFVGRLEQQKNLECLIQAVSSIGMSLDVYGTGSQEKKLKHLAESLGVSVHFNKTVPNSKLPQIYNRYRYFVLPSLYEGMPKTLLEAMACGCVCIGTDTLGIEEVIRDGENGFLARGFDTESIVRALQRAMRAASYTLVENGLMGIRETFSLNRIQDMEAKIFRGLV